MSESSVAPEIDRPSAKRRHNIFTRWWVWTILVAVVTVAVGVTALAANAMTVRSELQSAIPLAAELKTKAIAADIEGAQRVQTQIEKKLHTSSRIVGEPLWRVGEAVPLLGSNFTAVRELVEATDALMRDAVGPLVGIAATMDPASFAPVDGAIDTAPLTDAVPTIASANAALKKALTSVREVDTSGALEQVAGAKSQLAAVLAQVEGPLETLDAIVPLLGPALGTEAPRTYAVMFQNNAESRALGGTALSFAVVKVDRGRIELTEALPAGMGNFKRYPDSVVPVPDGVETLYPGGEFGAFIPNATLRPSFTTAAQIVQENWIRNLGYPVDGVLSLDPVALSYILRATGPITLAGGDVLTSDTLVPLLLNEVYLRFDSGNVSRDNLAQDLVYAEAVDATFSALTEGPLDASSLMAALAQGWDERRILFWSANADEQAQLAAIGLNGEIPVSDEKTDRVGLYFEENVASKLGFYTQQSVSLATGVCRPDGRQSGRVSAALTNSVDPSGADSLPISVAGRWEHQKLEPGVQRLVVRLYAPPGSEISGILVNGQPVAVEQLHDTDYPVGRVTVVIPPGETATVTYDFVTAAPTSGTKALEAQITPMVNPTAVKEEELDCSTVAAG